MHVTKKSLPRRTFLRGVGATIALPLLDGMIPAFTAIGKTAAKPVPRLGVVYVPNGMLMANWTPATTGKAFEFSPILNPLERFRSQLLVVSGLNNFQANGLPGEGIGDHSRGPSAFLSGIHPKKTEGADLQAGVSMDQIAAKELGKQTQLASLEVGLESNEMVGDCDLGYSCAYSSTIAWRGPATPLPMVADPRAIFERLFGDSDSTDASARRLRVREDRSILDAVAQKATRLQSGLGSQDRHKLAEYLEAIRDVERRIQRAEDQSGEELPLVRRPLGIPPAFEDHYRLICDLQVLAYQCDLTRVITFMVARESSDRVYPGSGVSDPHHPMSHHGGDAEKMLKVTKISTYHVRMFAYLLERLQATPDGEGSLLDHAMILYGGGISDGNRHTHDNLPILVAGGGAGQIRGGRHLECPKDTPVTNLHLALLDKMGVATERLGDSTGRLEHLADL